MNKDSIKYLLPFLVIIIFFSFLSVGCQKNIDVTLYFAEYEDDQAYLVPQKRTIELSEDILKVVISELIAGPESVELYPTIPSDTEVLDVSLSAGTATVDLSREVITNFTEIPHSSTTEPLAIYSMVNTLTEFEEIEKVRIMIEGKQEGMIEGLSIEDFWGHVGIHETFSRNEDIIRK